MKISKETNEEATTSSKTPSDSSAEKTQISKFPAAVIGDNPTGIDSDDEDETRGGETFSLTPVERSRKKFFDEKASFFRVAKWGVGILLTLLGIIATVLAIFYAYSISNVAEPIGGIKVEIEHLKEDNKDSKDRLKKVEDRLNNLPRVPKQSQ
jgi:hypothetical protein